ncbi:hypothetical protein L5515_019440 [Caenorhabditis briggsae]|uniref:MATH domain-containing protein n=1 Tax=Caenorhabditis briggsae TaxID=6238 RepID=A0AAE9FIZ9_CAEBR|nr:hypothetical protein L5515_019440 [Caenorhabditis briggsae]
MANNERGEAAPEEGHETETLGTLKIMMTAGNDEIDRSFKRKFEEITENLQIIEETVAKILKTNEDENKLRETSEVLNNQKELNSEKRFVLKHVFKNVAALEIGVPCFTEIVEKFNVKWYTLIERNEKHLGFVLFYSTPSWTNCATMKALLFVVVMIYGCNGMLPSSPNGTTTAEQNANPINGTEQTIVALEALRKFSEIVKNASSSKEPSKFDRLFEECFVFEKCSSSGSK